MRNRLGERENERCSQVPQLHMSYGDVLAVFVGTLFERNIWLCLFSVLIDVFTLRLTANESINTARVLLWSSWVWIIFRGRYFRVDKAGDQMRLCENNRSAVSRVLWKSLLTVIIVGCACLDNIVGSVAGNDMSLIIGVYPNNTLSPNTYAAVASAVHWSTRPTSNFTLFLVLGAHMYVWECFERCLLLTTNNGGKQQKYNSISQFIADSENKHFKHVLNFYGLFVMPALLLYAGMLVPFWFFFLGMVLLILVKTESRNNNGDDFQSFTHGLGMVIVIMVGVTITSYHRDLLWIAKFSSILPYFYQFATSLPTHKLLKIRAECKLFKHLGDLIVVVVYYM